VCACNDPSVLDLKITTESQTDAQAVVVANFQSHDEKDRIVLRYLLVKENGAWKVDDVISTGKDKWQVSKIVTGQ
jgi:ABC-type transporter MlaC component